MERIFYFSGYRMTVFDWSEARLISAQDFQPDEKGFAEFEYLLEHSVRMPARLLVDMIEEDFRRETIPHVNPFDRRALINRLIDRHFRDEPYSHARVIGRAELGRQDDRVLLSALTNTQLLAPWMERLEQANVRLAGIWSLPLLSDKLLKPVLKGNDEHALIVSRQVRSALRNSYFQKGKLLLSRQAKFDKEMWDRDDFAGVIHNLERGTLEIYNFLLNQRIMKPADDLNVYAILHQAQIEDAKDLSNDTDKVHYSFVSVEQLFKHFGIQNCENEGADTLFAYLCTRTNPLQDHYAEPDQKATYYRYLVDRVVSQVTEFGTLACLTGAVLLAMNSLEHNRHAELLAANNQLLQTNYDQVFGENSELLMDAPVIEKSVQLVHTLLQDAATKPHGFFGPLGSVLSQQEFAAVSLKELHWEKHSRQEITQIINSFESQLHDDARPKPDYSEQEYEEGSEALYAVERQAVMTVKGTISSQGQSYRQATIRMQRFIDALEALTEVERVLLVETTIDIRESARFSDQMTASSLSEANAVPDNAFEIMIILEVPANA